jgi:hypothetical protein
MNIKQYAGIVLLMLGIGCAHKTHYQRMLELMNDPGNKIVQSIQVGNVKVTTRLLPWMYRNTRPDSYHNMMDTTTAPPTHEDYSYFNVRFEKDPAGEKPTKEKVMYLDFDMQNDFTLLCGSDSIAPAICQKIETGITGRYEYLLAFDNHMNRVGNNNCTLYYKDKIFGLGVVAFVYNQKDVQKVVRLAQKIR